jgi:ABC-2 type transport system ATP-binding protein
MTAVATEAKTSERALEVKDLVKVYDPKAPGDGPVRALDGLTLEIAPRETLGFLGPNGAGKTTAIRTIATLVRPTSGSVKICGVDVIASPDAARMLLGYVPQEIALDRLLTVREHLVLAGRMHRLPKDEAERRASEVLTLIRLDDKAETRAKKLSGGMKKRLDLGMGLVHRPKLLVLDEPTVGLDLEARGAVWDFLQSLKASGTAILISTHSMEEAERLSDRVAIVDRGRVQRTGTPEALCAELEGNVLDVRLDGALPTDELLAAAKTVEGARAVTRTRAGFEVTTEKDPRTLAAILAFVKDKGRSVTSATYRRPTLEDVFRKAVGRGFQEAT